MITVAWQPFEFRYYGQTLCRPQNSIFEPNSAPLYHNFRFRQQVRSRHRGDPGTRTKRTNTIGLEVCLQTTMTAVDPSAA